MAHRRRNLKKIGTFQCQKRPPLKNSREGRAEPWVVAKEWVLLEMFCLPLDSCGVILSKWATLTHISVYWNVNLSQWNLIQMLDTFTTSIICLCIDCGHLN